MFDSLIWRKKLVRRYRLTCDFCCKIDDNDVVKKEGTEGEGKKGFINSEGSLGKRPEPVARST